MDVLHDIMVKVGCPLSPILLSCIVNKLLGCGYFSLSGFCPFHWIVLVFGCSFSSRHSKGQKGGDRNIMILRERERGR
jgi:hypothetical protein